MTWQNGRELASLIQNGKTLNFTYDLDGMRTKKAITRSTGSTTNVEYVYENGLLMQMKYGSYVLTFNYDATGTPIGFRTKYSTLDKYYYYGLNSRGDVIALYNEDGTLHATYEYDTYGKMLGVKAADGSGITATYAVATLNPLRYRGYVYDNETGLYYLQSRYYDPETCRFVNADGQLNTNSIMGCNQFSYVYNNPVMLSDYSGCRPVVGDSVSDETDEERRASFQYMKDLPHYNEVAETQVMLESMGFSNVTYSSAEDCLATMKTNGIDTTEEKAHFFAQCYVEGGLSVLEAGYLDEESAENYRKEKDYYPYYGAGYIQLTWDYNYLAFSEAMGDPKIYELGPKYVAEKYAWSAAGWFWTNNNINSRIAEGASVEDVTRIVNGGTSGLAQRQQCYYDYLYIVGG